MFDFNFNEVIADLGQMTAFEIANEARPAARYLFNTLLPEVQQTTYSVESGSMQITPTMAGLAAESSPYPKGGHISVSKFLEKTAKIANEVPLAEGQLRKLQSFVQQIRANGGNTTEFLQNEILNFLDKVIIQPHMDAMEYLRGRALVNGEIDWKYGSQRLTVDYGIPAEHMFEHRADNLSYAGADSMFWDDVRAVREALNYNVRAFIAHPQTVMAIMGNKDGNNVEVISDEGGIFRFRRLVTDGEGNGVRPSQDTRDQITFITYPESGEIVDPADTSRTLSLDFMPTGKILAVANNTRSTYRVGEGATDDPEDDRSLGYTHIAPTVEGGGATGRWARVYTPQNRQWQLIGQGVTNGLPVIENPEKLAVLSTDI